MQDYGEAEDLQFDDHDMQGPPSNQSDKLTVSSLLRRDKSQASIS